MPPELTTALIGALTGMAAAAWWLAKQIANYIADQRIIAQEANKTLINTLLVNNNKQEDVLTSLSKTMEGVGQSIYVHGQEHKELSEVIKELLGEVRDFNAMLKVIHRKHHTEFQSD